MGTEWKSQQCFDEGKYYLQFETDDRDKFKFMEKAAQSAIDGKLDIKTEVAKEIFAEIERLLDKYSTAQCFQGDVFVQRYFEYGLEDAIAEFKNKYTKEGEV